ncbi:hypothetical protein [Roseovarius sp. CH_XMU1461]|uniref:hypothetical protein n=1 Tax=Roseovarius sp. CH_XMU1461 TaxID=3107777 RepID=UPI0030093030
MATYVVVAKDQSSLGPNEINAGDTIYVEDGDQVIIDPSADDNIKFEAADGGPAQFEILFSNDAETESLYPGPQALASLGPAAVGELYQLFPELALPGVTIRMARFVPETGRAMKRLAARHQKNHKPLVERAA